MRGMRMPGRTPAGRVGTRLLIIVVLTVAAVTAGTPRAEAASSLRFGTFVADPSGTDKRDNAHINRETIQVRNVGSKKITLAGYRIRDKAKHTFVFPKGFTLAAHATVTVHTGKGTNSRTNLYWKQGNYVWNNNGDTAYLADTHGKTVATCTYKKVKSGTKKC